VGRMNDEIQSPGTAEDSTLARVRKARKEADESGQTKWRKDAQECYAFVAGDQWDPTVKAQLIEEMRPPVTFNRIGPMVDSVAGSEVNNRQQVQYIPRTVGDKALNEVLTGAADYVRDNCDAEDEESHAFVDTNVCGLGVTETRLDYEEDPEGQILIERRDPLAMRWDPGAKKRNLMDRRWHQYDAYLTRDEVLAKWPDAELSGAASGIDNTESTQPHDDSRAAWYENDSSDDAIRAGKLLVIHHQWYEVEPFYQVLLSESEITDMTVGEFGKLSKRIKEFNAAEGLPPSMAVPMPEFAKKTRRKYMQAFTCGSTVLAEGPVPCNRFTFHFMTAKQDRNSNTWYGIVRPMLDPQRWANKFLSQTIHIINTNAKGGLVMEEDAVDNIAKFKADWSKADGVSVVNPGAISGNKIQPKVPPVIPPQMGDLLQFSISSMRDVTGINLELLGMADRQQAGVLEAQRKQAAMTVLASLFDGLRRYRKEQGRTLAAFITEYLSDGRLVRIVGGDGTERYVPLVRDRQAVKYDVIVDEAPASVNQKERTFALLMQMLPNLAQMGLPFAPELLEYSPLPAAMVEKWKEVIAKQPQQMDPRMVQQLQEANQQLHQQLQQAEAALRDKQAEIQAGLQEAQMKSDAEAMTKLRQAEIDAEAHYRTTVQKATIDAQAAIDRAIVDGQAKVAVAEATAAATPAQQPTVVQIPQQQPDQHAAEISGALVQLMTAFQQVTSRMDQLQSDAKRKPKGFTHETDPKTGAILRSIPVFD
jgi:hypothetical protein